MYKKNYIYDQQKHCLDCGKLITNKALRCLHCAAVKRCIIVRPNWKGGRRKHHSGYIETRIYEDNPFFSMTHRSGYILEHRLVKAQELEHCLTLKEQVHHLNGIKDDNRPENLIVLYKNKHHPHLLLQAVQRRLRELEIERFAVKK